MCHPGIIDLHEATHQLRDLHHPLGTQHGDHLVDAFRGGGVELREYLQGRVLVLEGAAPALSPFLLLVIIQTLPD